jgi:PilZ domain-containing protein
MTSDRRDNPRVNHYFECRWFGQWGATDARVQDLSATGCYIVNRSSSPSVGETVEIDVMPVGVAPLALSGTVVDVQRGVGFAVHFAEVGPVARERIKTLMETADSSNRRATGA